MQDATVFATIGAIFPHCISIKIQCTKGHVVYDILIFPIVCICGYVAMCFVMSLKNQSPKYVLVTNSEYRIKCILLDQNIVTSISNSDWYVE